MVTQLALMFSSAVLVDD